MLGHNWVPGEGAIVDVRWSGHKDASTGSGQMPHFIVDARPATGEPFRTEIDELMLSPSFVAPAPGKVVQLECDPGRKKARFARSDPAINGKVQEREYNDRYAAELKAPPGSPGAG